MLAIPSPNVDRSLLTLAQLRAAVGVEDGSKDAALIDLGNYVAVLIAQACRVATAAGIPPTLRLETIVETIVLDRCAEWLVLARIPVVSITSVIENGTEIDSTGYRLAGSTGRLQRRSGSFAALWPRDCDIVVTYSAGWAIVPDDLARAAIKFVQAEWNEGSRDPLLRRVRVEGVSEREYWVDPTKDSVVPADVMDILERGGFVMPVFP
jgi:uncharacterized protein YbdZ (MbtH family)